MQRESIRFVSILTCDEMPRAKFPDAGKFLYRRSIDHVFLARKAYESGSF